MVPTYAAVGEMKVYFGNLHAHTSMSDGKLTPAEAFAYARDVAKLDFMAVTDHEEQIDPYYDPSDPKKWPREKEQTEASNQDGTFVAILGYEWGSPPYNHLNFFNVGDHFFSIDPYLPHVPLVKLWNEVGLYASKTPPGAIMQFNHPDWNPDNAQFNWNQFEYNAKAAQSAAFLEIKDPGQEKSYQLALDKGWHVSAIYNQDNHQADWGTENDCRAALWMNGLTRVDLYEAMRARRCYSTCNKNTVVDFKGNGVWMGSSVTTKAIKLEWKISDADPTDTIDKVEVITNAGVVLKTDEPKANSASGSLDVVADVSGTYYYLRITTTAPNGKPAGVAMVYTGPIYYYLAPVTDGGTPDGSADGGSEPGSGGCSCSAVGM